MKGTILLMISLLAFSCKKEGKLKPVVSEIKQDSSIITKDKQPEKVELSDEEILKIQKEEEKKMSEIVRKYTLQKNGNGFEYQVFCEEQKNGMINFRKVNILKSGKLLQQLKVEKDSTFVYHDYEVDFSCDEDWNFDGFKDFKLINWVGMVDQSYYLWLFDKSSGKYKLAPSFGKIINPVADQNKKEITSGYHTGPTNYYFIYKWNKGRFIQTYAQVDGDEK